MAKEGRQKTAATLGDVLYAKSKAPVPEQDWAALVQSVAAGDQLALHALYERAHRLVFTLAVRITGSRETAEEVTGWTGGRFSLWGHVGNVPPQGTR